MLPVREGLEHSHAIITDRSQPVPLLTDVSKMLFQLDELGFAKRSPIRRTEENQQRALGAKDSLQVLRSTVLIQRLK
jgi:hypothetical protein